MSDSSDPGQQPRLEAIGVFHCAEQYPFEAPRQGSLRTSAEFATTGLVRLRAPEQTAEGNQAKHDYAQGLRELAGFERIWLVYGFHQNRSPNKASWKPIVSPPRANAPRVGVFASRSPYRPNGLGLSCVRLLDVAADRGELAVAEYDLLDGTPIYDIKPYVPYADSFPDARAGWIDELPPARQHRLECTAMARTQLDWLRANQGPDLLAFAQVQLREDPDDAKRKRIKRLDPVERNAIDEFASDSLRELAYRTWRICYRLPDDTDSPADPKIHIDQPLVIQILKVYSGYAVHELDAPNTPDQYGDLELHRAFRRRFAHERS